MMKSSEADSDRSPIEDLSNEGNPWWNTLRQEGVVLSAIVLDEVFPHGPARLPDFLIDKARTEYGTFLSDSQRVGPWLDFVLEELLDHSPGQWYKGADVPNKFRNGIRRASRVLVTHPPGGERAQLLLLLDKERVSDPNGKPGRIGVNKGRREVAEFIKLLRDVDVELGILTNGHQFRLIHVGVDQARWVEWEAEEWFQGGEGRTALEGFCALLNGRALPSFTEPTESPLYHWISRSRERQADLSHVMTTQVREAVEILLQELDDSLQTSPAERNAILAPLRRLNLTRSDEHRAIYQAAIRFVMRLVVALYAESRDLFPKSNPIYFGSYSAETLFHDLSKARISEGEDALESVVSAWPRLQSLFRLIHEGSPHPDLPIPAYDGELFRPPRDTDDDDTAAATLAMYQHGVRVSDLAILRILEKLKIGQFRIPRGGWRSGPVDFSDLRTEYIGMMYEGLLDFELREVADDDVAIVVLNLGDQPTLPFKVLPRRDRDETHLRRLFDDLGKPSQLLSSEEEEDDEMVVEDEADEKPLSDAGVSPPTKDAEETAPTTQLEKEVHDWARWAVRTTGVFLPGKKTLDSWDPTRREIEVDRAARRLVLRVIPPGGLFLVHWSGTRKGTGTFYTKPGLAFPTVRRVLDPLLYRSEGERKIPKQPEEILRTKICDPAMGSGSFLVASLNHITHALRESFDYHVLSNLQKGSPVTERGAIALGVLNERILPIILGEHDENFELRVDAQLKRAVVEHCIYGVDINPLAVELGKLSLWIETMNPSLPFTYLDHKIRCGNSLVGAWLHQHMHYPVAAWLREGGDGKSGERTRFGEEVLATKVKPQLITIVRQEQYDTSWLDIPKTRVELASVAKSVFERIHDAPSDEERARIFRDEISTNPDFLRLRHLLDRWCALWFWPLDPGQPVLDPDRFYGAETDRDTDPIVQKLAADPRLRFFHWELEFPDVFGQERWGFDAVIGNPPWETHEPSSLEFFLRYLPEIRTYGKREASQVIKQLLANSPAITEEWIRYVEYHRSFSNYTKNRAEPFSVQLLRGRQGKTLESLWKQVRKKTDRPSGDVGLPYAHQGKGKIYTYKLFAEMMHSLCRETGRLAMIVPARIYADQGPREIRRLFLEQNSWDWIYSFSNEKKIFPIHPGYKFCVLIVTKGGRTTSLRCRFMVTDLIEWGRQANPYSILLTLPQVRRFSPDNLSILEIDQAKDIEILNRLYSNAILLRTLEIEYSQGDFNISSDSDKFRTREEIIKDGAQVDSSGCAWKNGKIEALPLLEGRHLDLFDYRSMAHVRGRGRKALWRPVPWSAKELVPNFMVPIANIEWAPLEIVRIGLMDVTAPTNLRTLRATILPRFPTGHSVSILGFDSAASRQALAITAILCSYACDFAVRAKPIGLHVGWYVLQEIPIPNLSEEKERDLAEKCASLALDVQGFPEHFKDFVRAPILDPIDRARIQEDIDKLVAEAYGLTEEDMVWILRSDNTDRRSLWKDYKDRLKVLGGKGYWGAISSDPSESDNQVLPDAPRQAPTTGQQ